MAALDLALDRLTGPGLGVLVLDDYTEIALRRRRIGSAALVDLVDLVLHPPAAPPSPLGGLLVSPAHLTALRPALSAVGREHLLGVGVTTDSGPGTVTDSLASALDLGASFVELRANRRPGQFDRGQVHVDAPAVAGAAARAQQSGLVPVLTVALPGLAASRIGVTRAVTANALHALTDALAHQGGDPARMIVRMPLISPGPASGLTAPPDEVARHTLDTLAETVPSTVPAVWFLSAGHALETVCRQLTAVRALAMERGESRAIGFALGRALLEPALDSWATDGPAPARRRLSAAGDAAYRSLVPALTPR